MSPREIEGSESFSKKNVGNYDVYKDIIEVARSVSEPNRALLASQLITVAALVTVMLFQAHWGVALMCAAFGTVSIGILAWRQKIPLPAKQKAEFALRSNSLPRSTRNSSR